MPFHNEACFRRNARHQSIDAVQRLNVIPWLLCSALFAAGCDTLSTVSPDPPPLRTVVFQKVLERDVSEITGLPSGVAVTPDGRWLISLGFGAGTVTVYDAATLELVMGPLHEIPCPPPLSCSGFDPIFLSQPHAVVVSTDGAMAVLTSRNGVTGLRVPSLELVFNAQIQGLGAARHVVRDRAGENYYVSGEGTGIARLNAAGELQALYEEAFIPTAISLSRDEGDLLVMTDTGRRFVILTASDLEPRLSVDLPDGFMGQVVVPLKDHDHAIIVGGAFSGETVVDPPVRALTIDLSTGSVGAFRVLFEGTGGNIAFGDGNEWTEVGEATAIVPTLAGTVTIDTNAGAVAFHPAADLQREMPPCCDIASYPSGDRVVFTAADLHTFGASLIVYDVEEDITPVSD